MDLQEVWKRMESEKLTRPVLGAVEVRKKSNHPVAKLKRAYLISTGFSLVFLLGFIALFFSFDAPIIKGSLSLVILGYVFFLTVNLTMYRRINEKLPVDQSLRTVLAHTHAFISENIRFQERVALFIYPVAATAGFVVGLAAGGDVNVLFEKKSVIVVLLVVIAVLTPLAFYLARWMYKVSYGSCLTEIRHLIDELDNPA